MMWDWSWSNWYMCTWRAGIGCCSRVHWYWCCGKGGPGRLQCSLLYATLEWIDIQCRVLSIMHVKRYNHPAGVSGQQRKFGRESILDNSIDSYSHPRPPVACIHQRGSHDLPIHKPRAERSFLDFGKFGKLHYMHHYSSRIFSGPDQARRAVPGPPLSTFWRHHESNTSIYTRTASDSPLSKAHRHDPRRVA